MPCPLTSRTISSCGTAALGKRLAHLFESDCLLEQRQDLLASIDTIGPPVAAQRLRTRIAMLAFQRPSAARTGRADAEAIARLTADRHQI